MSIPAFHFDGVSSDDETAFIDIIGGYVLTIERQDNGLAVSLIRWVQDGGYYENIGAIHEAYGKHKETSNEQSID